MFGTCLKGSMLAQILWKEGEVVFFHILGTKKILEALGKHAYYGTSLKFAPKFVIDYVLKNWEYKTNDLGYEVWHEPDVNEITVMNSQMELYF